MRWKWNGGERRERGMKEEKKRLHRKRKRLRKRIKSCVWLNNIYAFYVVQSETDTQSIYDVAC